MEETDALEEKIAFDGAEGEAERDRLAADDLRRIEEEVKQEAEASVEDFDDEGDEGRSVEAAGTAFDFDQAVAETRRIVESM
ncbi:MAG TPA: BAG1 BAG family molecular chaperone regulator 1 [Candidatus Rubneribacter avistercoris]|nr:BAG1 BAG family molecular chaperone regulator 1 [Candidatus Rubneribacter avistercoris]